MNLSPPMSRVRALPVPPPDTISVAVPAAVALAAGLWDLTGPPPWRDEAATASAVNRTLPQMLDLLQQVDAVHGVYYALVHVVATLFGTSDVVLRLPSVVAGMLAAGGLAALGRSLGNPRAGLYGGLLLAVMPIFSRYVQEARPYGLTMAAAVGVTLLLVRGVRAPTRRIFFLYGVALAGLAYLNLFAFLVAGAHGVYVAWVRGPIGKWCGAVALALAAIGPLAWIASGQTGQVGWIGPPSQTDLEMLAVRIFGDLGEPGFTWVGMAPVVGGLVLLGITRRGKVVRLALPWLLVPPLTLLIVSWTGHPFYVFRYVLCVLPAAALLAGVGLAALPRRVGVGLFAVVVALAIPSQLAARGPDGRTDDPDPLAAVLGTAARPGDAVLFFPSRARKFALMYPGVFSRLDDVSLRTSPGRDGSFDGREFGSRKLAARLVGVRTIWVFGVIEKMRATDWRFGLLQISFVPTGLWTSKGMTVIRYQGIGDRPTLRGR